MRHSLGSRVVMNTDWVWGPAEMCLATPAVCRRFSWWWRIPCALWAKLCQVSASSWTVSHVHLLSALLCPVGWRQHSTSPLRRIPVRSQPSLKCFTWGPPTESPAPPQTPLALQKSSLKPSLVPSGTERKPTGFPTPPNQALSPGLSPTWCCAKHQINFPSP